MTQDAATIAAALTSRGLTVDGTGESADDTILDIDVPANRPDCLGHLGLARELAAAFGLGLTPVEPAPSAVDEPIEDRIGVEIHAPDLCPRYTARIVTGVTVGPSPDWVVRRLDACGLRSVNNVVDVSNLVLLEFGQPIHVFDLRQIEGGVIHVRRASRGEKITTLDGVSRSLDETMLVIADSRRAVALAGIMGGADSEIRPDSRDVLIEAAHFSALSVRRTSKRLGLTSDSSYRFERGVDPEAPPPAQDRAVALIVELAGGAPLKGMLDRFHAPPPPRHLSLRMERIRLLLGYDPGEAEAERALGALGLKPRLSGRPATWNVEIPPFRIDLDSEADLVEEVARHIGYDRIPMRLPSWNASPPAAAPDPEEVSRDRLVSCGFHEAVSYAMLGRGEDDPFVDPQEGDAVGLKNPIAEPLAVLRRSMVPGLLRAADLNLRRGTRDVRLFEVGRVFLGRSGSAWPEERRRLACAWCGSANPSHWSQPPRPVDFHDLAGVAEAVAESLGVRLPSPRAGAGRGYHPGRSATWRSADGRRIASGGEIHPAMQAQLDIAAPVYLLEIDLDALVDAPVVPRRFVPLSRYPTATRDLSLVIPRDLAFEDLLKSLRSVPGPAPAGFTLLDRYVGAPLAPGEVSVTVRFSLSPTDRTLTDSETERFRDLLAQVVAENLGVRVRSVPARDQANNGPKSDVFP